MSFIKPRSRKAFTLLELIVVIVILGILAALAIPTFTAVIDKTKDQTAGATLSSIARNAQALSAFDPESGFVTADYTKAIEETQGSAEATGVFAAASQFTLAPGGEIVSDQPGTFTRSTKYSEVGVALGSSSQVLGLAMKSQSGKCIYVKSELSSASTWAVSAGKLVSCDPSVALSLTGDDGTVVTPGGPGVTPPVTSGMKMQLRAYTDYWEGNEEYPASYSEYALGTMIGLPAGTAPGDEGVKFECTTDIPFPVEADTSAWRNSDTNATGQVYSEHDEIVVRTYTCTGSALDPNGVVLEEVTLSATVNGDVAGPASTTPAFPAVTAQATAGLISASWPAIIADSVYISGTATNVDTGNIDGACFVSSSISAPATSCDMQVTGGDGDYIISMEATYGGKFPYTGVATSTPVIVNVVHNRTWANYQSASVSDPTATVGKALASAGLNTLFVGNPDDDDMGTNVGSVTVFTRSNPESPWTKKTEIYPSATSTDGQFGQSLEFENGTLMIGAPSNYAGHYGNRSGAIYVFQQEGNDWVEQDMVRPNEDDLLYTGATNGFGNIMDFDGQTLVSLSRQGSYGRLNDQTIFSYRLVNGVWAQEAAIFNTGPGDDADGAGGNIEGFGDSLSIDGNTLIAGARFNSDQANLSGAAYIYTRASGEWELDESLYSPDLTTEARYGASVAVEGTTALVGEPGKGLVHVYTKNGANWDLQTSLDGGGQVELGAGVALGNGIIAATYSTGIIVWDSSNGERLTDMWVQDARFGKLTISRDGSLLGINSASESVTYHQGVAY